MPVMGLVAVTIGEIRHRPGRPTRRDFYRSAIIIRPARIIVEGPIESNCIASKPSPLAPTPLFQINDLAVPLNQRVLGSNPSVPTKNYRRF